MLVHCVASSARGAGNRPEPFFSPPIILSNKSFFLTYFSQYLAHNLAIFPIINYIFWYGVSPVFEHA